MADQEASGPAMLPAQRQDRILAEIERVGGARITQLAELLGVSEMTVRRDIDALARRSLIKKVYGGATAPARSTSDEPGFEAKSHRELAAKDQIGADGGFPDRAKHARSRSALARRRTRQPSTSPRFPASRWSPTASG